MKIGITMLIHNKDDIEFVTEFSCFLGHPVSKFEIIKNHKNLSQKKNKTYFNFKLPVINS